jgi:hypothetical protein
MRGPTRHESRPKRRDSFGGAALHHQTTVAKANPERLQHHNKDTHGTSDKCADRLPKRQSKGRFGTKSPITYAESYETLRYASQNINRFHHTDAASKIRSGEGFKIHRSVGVTVLGLVETNTEWDHNNGQGMKSIKKQVVGAYAHAR